MSFNVDNNQFLRWVI